MKIRVNMLSGAMALMFPLSSSKPVSWGWANQSRLKITHFLLQAQKSDLEKWKIKILIFWIYSKHLLWDNAANDHHNNIQLDSTTAVISIFLFHTIYLLSITICELYFFFFYKRHMQFLAYWQVQLFSQIGCRMINLCSSVGRIKSPSIGY